jgi:predicted  nucleic acid-binding Zn-ribbon protein
MTREISTQENELNNWRGWWNESGRKIRDENEKLRERLDGLKDGRVLDVARYEREVEEVKADIKKLLEWIDEQRLKGVWKEDMVQRKIGDSVNSEEDCG